MTRRSAAPGRSPAFLRWLHALVFLGFAAGAVAGARPDWQLVLSTLRQPYPLGAPPRPMLLLGSALAVAGGTRLMWAWVRGRSASLGASWLILGGGVSAVLGAAGSPPPEPPSEPAFNIALIQWGQRVQRAMVGQLQERGEVPVLEEPWRVELERAGTARIPVRDRTFRLIPPQALMTASPEALPERLVPGTLLVYVSPDGASFELRLAGLEGGAPVILRDDTRAPLVLRGLYNPDLPDPPAHPPP
ncbi:hypothetical protein [Stigmatella aurantiaca]|uniref:Conserved uncharacterized protein n=1 Tax=Stigmatella aurantiaca (strain DW4/3-1) TaxID=378806 RepID=E3FPL0_STIAD|nr:hypothetical protein [Stigmatella aurantiaca]ADO73205.1 conserved uncharacterized protein [Stigmatella aurantiaca DW4/3-1]